MEREPFRRAALARLKASPSFDRRCASLISLASMMRGRIPRMRVVNRTAVTVTGAQPYIDWMRATDADFNRGALTVPRTKAYGSAFLLPEFDLEEDLQEWVEDNVAWLFDFQL